MENSGLTKDDIFNIRSVFSNYPQIEEALLYGSRAMGNYKPASDIDISLIGDEIDLSLINQVEFDLDDLMLPYKIDLSIYHKIKNPELLDHISRVGKNLYQRRMNTDYISN
ncbi:hypothetical protein MATR_11210 [Marivirga tractuosa]|uniref:DNA polymerase beta domain protein region n=1 Tax=Marivirga tractuosa (strain ATCC 23168 / DSM 4126 / NBRC 15989 / NCIMB 1408 / VKM B-1430 / H-43) TaxID=643867 RepID=E4TLC9_MARTH|nr:nucleotidyltransferase domain-containing protein [Marivirga tractuosa]ADR21250.1 DNA polymerase beta domain protein region [Marivirga tractuosa DSM 4126]BDD14296.1 hypothetical protein MATR_11210 [Marivirga tractuosa]